MHNTVYTGHRVNHAHKQGDVFIVVEGNGVWRLMHDHGRTDAGGEGVELYPFKG